MNNLTTTNQKSLAQREQRKTFSMFIGQESIRNQINQIVGGANGQRFITAIISAASTNTALQECTHSSILSGALLGETLKLSPSPQLGQYYLVPFKKKGKDKEPDETIATFVLGYKGYIQLAIRSGYYKKMNVLSIKEGELVSYDPLTEEIKVNLIEDDEVRENTPTIGYYAMFEYENGFTKSIYWSKKKMLIHADKFSKAFNIDAFEKLQKGEVPEKELYKYSSFWYKDFDGMAYKTMLRQLISKWGIMSIDMQKAIESDNAFIDENGNAKFVEGSVVEEQKPEQPNESITLDNDDPFNE